MRALERLLGKDVVTLIYRHLHAMDMAEIVGEYKRRVCRFYSRSYISMFWSRSKLYNYRRLPMICGDPVANRHCAFVAPLSKNY